MIIRACLVGIWAVTAFVWSGATMADGKTEPQVFSPVQADTSRPLRDIIRERDAIQPTTPTHEVDKPREIPNRLVPDFLQRVERPAPLSDPTRRAPLSKRAPAAGLSFDGFDNLDNVALIGGQVAPPDPNGDVGQNFYIQYVNVGWKIFNKADGSLAGGPFIGNIFWAGFGGACEADNAGDPIVLYDELADRWVFSQFADPITPSALQCYAISTTNDPLGPYHRYAFSVPGIDYPKIGIFSDGASRSGYYFSTNNFGIGFNGVSLMAAERDKMLVGDPTAQFIKFDLSPASGAFALQPGHIEGTELPNSGTCNVFVQAFDDEVFGAGGGPDGYRFWELCPDFAAPNNSTLSAPIFVDAGVEFDSELCGFAACIPQPGTPQLLDSLSQFTMYRAAVRVNPTSAPGSSRMVVSHTVDVGANQAGVRWVELDLDAGPSIVDQGVYAPDGDSRWLPSIAMDTSGNIAIAYSRGGASKEPSIYFTGRETTDPAGMLQSEQVCVDGGGVQTGTDRWVDYSSLSVDPVDQCTFWYTTEYYPATSTFTWGTRVCSFRFDSCGVDRVVLNNTSENTEQLACAPGDLDDIDFDVSLSTGAIDAVTMGSSGLPLGFSVNYTANPVDPTPGSTSAQITLDGSVVAGSYAFDLTGAAAGFDTAQVGVSVDVSTAVPGVAPTLINPVNGIKDIGGNVTFEWSVVPGATSYQLQVSEFGAIVVDQVSDDTTLTLSMDLPPGDYFWRVTALNGCGAGAASGIRTFSVAAPAQSLVLLVDDDDNLPNVVDFFADALANLGITFDVFDTGNSDLNEPDSALLNQFAAIVWFSGDEFGGAAGPSAASEAALETYLNAGGCLLMSSQDYFFDKGLTPFMTNFLGVDSAVSDITQTTVVGQGTFAGLGPYSLDFGPAGLANFSDELNPTEDAEIGFQGNAGFATQVAATTVSGGFETAFLGFPLPAIPTASDREDVLAAFILDRCGATVDAGGELVGRVTVSGTNLPIAGATITAERGGAAVTATTDANGDYAFSALTAGFYVVSVNVFNGGPVAPVINLEIAQGATTTQDFQVDAGAIAYDNAPLIETLGSNSTVTNPLTINNIGTLALDYLVNIANFDFGLPANPMTTSGHNNNVGQRSSGGLSAALTAPERLRGGPTDVSAAPGDFLIQAPFPEGAPLGITMSPTGDIWVADLFSGNTVRYNDSLFIQETIPHPTGLAITSGIAYDTVNDTLWWLDGGFSFLVEGTLDGTATGNLIPLTVSVGGLAAGVEYDPLNDAFFYVDIAADDIYAVDRNGAVLVGYPVPQTSFDDGSGLFGNGLDVINGNLDVLVGTLPEGQVTRSVLTDLFGNNTGGETPLGAIPDTFINDAVRSRLDPNEAIYVVGNATSTIYVVEPVNLILSRRWASATPETGTIPAGSSVTLDLTYDSTGLPFDTYQAELNLGGTFVNQVDAKPLGLIVEGSPGLSLSFTAYLGSDNGDRCIAGGDETLPAESTQAITFCVDLTNTGDTFLTDPNIAVASLGVTQSNMILKLGDLPWVPSERLLYYFVVAAPDTLPSAIEATVSANPVDGQGGSIPGPGTQSASDQVTVEQGNTAPVASNRNVRTDEDIAVFVRLRATDVDGDRLTFALTSRPQNGTITGVPPVLTYTPNANFHGLDSFTYVANDGVANSNQATVAITVNSVNDIPVADPQNLATTRAVPINITLTATDVETAILDYALVTLPSNGALTGVPPHLTYRPNAGFTGVDAFLFVAFDGTDPSPETAVTITVTRRHGRPLALNQSVYASEDQEEAITLTGFDPQGDTLVYTIVDAPRNGNLFGTLPNVTYTPARDFNGNDTFTFKVSDGVEESTVASVDLLVAPINDTPQVADDEFTTLPGVAVVGDVSTNDYDVDNDILTYEILVDAEHGTLILNNDGTFSYAPEPGFRGTERVMYGVRDGAANMQGNVSIKVGEDLFSDSFE